MSSQAPAMLMFSYIFGDLYLGCGCGCATVTHTLNGIRKRIFPTRLSIVVPTTEQSYE